MKTTTNCETCGKRFSSYNPNPRFCSRRCKDISLEIAFNVNEAIHLYYAGASQEELAERYNITQKAIWGAFRRRGVKCRKAAKRNQSGCANDSWKGDDAKYAALHIRVQKVRGKPRKCEVCGTTKAKRYEWANLTGNYADPNDYKRMCRSCHSTHDGIVRNLKCAKGGDAP